MDIPLERRFKVLCEIVRAQHFAWREAALALAPQLVLLQTHVPDGMSQFGVVGVAVQALLLAHP